MPAPATLRYQCRTPHSKRISSTMRRRGTIRRRTSCFQSHGLLRLACRTGRPAYLSSAGYRLFDRMIMCCCDIVDDRYDCCHFCCFGVICCIPINKMGAFVNLKRNAEAIPELLFRSRKSNGQATICFPGPRRPKASDGRVRCETTPRSVSDALHYFPEKLPDVNEFLYI